MIGWLVIRTEEARPTMEALEGLEEAFIKASTHLRSLAGGGLESEDLLYFYARYKQALEGPCTTPKPHFFDFQGKQKWNAWKLLADMSKDQAMAEYVERMDRVDPGWPQRAGAGTAGWGTAVSTLARGGDLEDLDDADKTLLDWIKEGNLTKVEEALVERPLTSDGGNPLTDGDDGLSPIHWAADRGHEGVFELILRSPWGRDPNVRDPEGQTPLHYACSNGHLSVVRILLAHPDVDPAIRDSDGLLASDAASDHPEVLELFRQRKANASTTEKSSSS